jgi:vancomycin resistance protein YoaR
MLKPLFLALATLAIAHMLAFAGFALWLYRGDRLNAERVERVREVFSTTIAAERAGADRAAAEAQAEQEAQAIAARSLRAPTAAATRIGLISEVDDINTVTAERIRAEIDDLRKTLGAESARIQAQQESLQADRDAFAKERARLAAIEGSQQFRKTLERLELLKPTQAKEVLQALLDEKKTEEVVAYLNAMQARTSAKVLALFDPRVAADLLERIRTRGTTLAAGVPEP